MTELILHVGERLAALDQERGVGVPEVVEADPTEARLLEQGQPDAMHEVQGVDRPVDPIREYPRREIAALNGSLGLEKRFPPLERSRERGGEVHAARLARLRAPNQELAAAVADGPPDLDEVASEVEVGPLESEDLALAHPGPRGQGDQVQPLRVPPLAGAEEGRKLGLGERSDR